jgi:hypothetical protein
LDVDGYVVRDVKECRVASLFKIQSANAWYIQIRSDVSYLSTTGDWSGLLLGGVPCGVGVFGGRVGSFCGIVGVLLLEPRVEVSPDAVELLRPVCLCCRGDRGGVARCCTLRCPSGRLRGKWCHCLDGSVGEREGGVAESVTESISWCNVLFVEVSVVDVEAFGKRLEQKVSSCFVGQEPIVLTSCGCPIW